MTDKTTKFLLLLIALALWANLISPLLQPPIVAAQKATMDDVDERLSNIESDVNHIAKGLSNVESNVDDIARGKCKNSKLCE
jgi:hypothetical protein